MVFAMTKPTMLVAIMMGVIAAYTLQTMKNVQSVHVISWRLALLELIPGLGMASAMMRPTIWTASMMVLTVVVQTSILNFVQTAPVMVLLFNISIKILYFVNSFIIFSRDKSFSWEKFIFFLLDSFSGCDGTTPVCCTDSHHCGIYEGHCDSHHECIGHLRCGSNNCFDSLPFTNGDDCCFDPVPSMLFMKIRRKLLFIYFIKIIYF